jgi:hypothetical protein
VEARGQGRDGVNLEGGERYERIGCQSPVNAGLAVRTLRVRKSLKSDLGKKSSWQTRN